MYYDILMYSNCEVLLVQGPNKGKRCKEVCKTCRHKTKICQWCNEKFNRDTAYYGHIKVCAKACIEHKTPKIKPVVKPRSEGKESYIEVIAKITEEIVELRKIIQQPSITNVTYQQPVTYQQILISDAGAYKILCEKMGSGEATNFLCELAGKPKTMTLFEKVYLDCDKADYPIANSNGKDFYYRDSDNNIIRDEGGHQISKLGDRLIKNTFIEAADPLLTRFMKHNVGDLEGDDGDYDKFRELQNAACAVKTDKTFVNDLSFKTYNPNHTFFKLYDD
jgi:hypothetical protein